MKIIPVYSETYGNKEILVDDFYYSLLMRFNWYIITDGSGQNYYAVTNFKKFTLRMHNFLFPNAEVVDHINGNGLDNREENLRPTSQKLNNRNKHKRFKKSSKFKGVHKKGNRWHAQICYNGQKINLGDFSNEEAAAMSYNVAAKEHHGEYASLNNIDNILNYLEYKCNKVHQHYKCLIFDKTRNKPWRVRIKKKTIKFYKDFQTKEEAIEIINKLIGDV